MTRDEWNELADALAESWKSNDHSALGADSAGERPEVSTVESVVRRVVENQAAVDAHAAENIRPGPAPSTLTAMSANGSSTAMEALKVAGMVTGVGPIVTGLIKLFGGGSDDKQERPAPVRYELPSAVHVDAGLMPGRSLAPVSYAQNNVVRSDVVQPSVNSASPMTPAMPAVQIQVNAMDSRSFMDHSDEIAQAVRSAMLRSHAINDVISEV